MTRKRPLLTWLGVIRRRPVVVSSALPPDEFLQRLAQVTSRRGALPWSPDPRTVPRADPRFLGEAGRSYVQLALPEAVGRFGYPAWLTAVPWVSDDGGTELRGWIAPSENSLPLSAGVLYLASLGLLTSGVTMLATGHINGVGPTLVCPLPAIVIAALTTWRWRFADQGARDLIAELDEVVDSTVTFLDE